MSIFINITRQNYRGATQLYWKIKTLNFVELEKCVTLAPNCLYVQFTYNFASNLIHFFLIN